MAILDATHNQNLHVMLNSGYFDLATPFFTADYEMKHLPISPAPMKNIETHYIRVRPHGLRASAVAAGTARQRRRIHRQHRQHRWGGK
jgi:hypothetical protein